MVKITLSARVGAFMKVSGEFTHNGQRHALGFVVEGDDERDIQRFRSLIFCLRRDLAALEAKAA